MDSNRTGVLRRFKDCVISIFLPIGFPQSVTNDFARNQVLHMLQTMTSQAAQLLANRAVLQGLLHQDPVPKRNAGLGVGVSDLTSTATSAGTTLSRPRKTNRTVLMTVVQDTTGRLATIWFAWLASASLGIEPKKYKILADILFDIALVSDCLVPRALWLRLPLLCFSSVSRALCGIMAGGVSATITAHFAKGGNVADVSAKSTSLSTVSQLLGTLRASLILRHLFDPAFQPGPLSNIPTPESISRQEALFANGKVLGHPSHTADFGVSSSDLYSIVSAHPSNPAADSTLDRISALDSIFAGEKYMLWFRRLPHNKLQVLISSSSHSALIHFRAWSHAYVLAGIASGTKTAKEKSADEAFADDFKMVSESLRRVRMGFNRSEGIEKGLTAKGWSLEMSMMCINGETNVKQTVDKLE